MKKTIVFLALLFCTTLFAQDYSSLENYPLKSAESYVSAEPKVVECVNYLFSHPAKENELTRLQALQFILRWMEGAAHTFNIDSKMTDLVDNNDDLFGLYLAGMSKVVINDDSNSLSDSEIHDKTVALLIEYCKNESNGVKPSKKMKKLMK